MLRMRPNSKQAITVGGVGAQVMTFKVLPPKEGEGAHGVSYKPPKAAAAVAAAAVVAPEMQQ